MNEKSSSLLLWFHWLINDDDKIQSDYVCKLIIWNELRNVLLFWLCMERVIIDVLKCSSDTSLFGNIYSMVKSGKVYIVALKFLPTF